MLCKIIFFPGEDFERLWNNPFIAPKISFKEAPAFICVLCKFGDSCGATCKGDSSFVDVCVDRM